MKKFLLDILVCPICKGELKTAVVKQDGNEIMEGTLSCRNHGEYPIIGGIPIMLPNAYDRKTEENFNRQWSYFEYGKTPLWGVPLNERAENSLRILGLNDSTELNGRVMLDGGCGDGEIDFFLAPCCREIVAVDLSDSVFAAKKACRADNVHFVKGDLINLPFRDGTFDVVHSCGVIHHTPDSKRSFLELARTAKDKGKIGVWVYKKRGIKSLKDALATVLRGFVVRLPGGAQDAALKAALPIFLLNQSLLSKSSQNWKTKLVHIYDSLSHPYARQHGIEEVKGWFAEGSIENASVSEDDITGFGVCGFKRSRGLE